MAQPLVRLPCVNWWRVRGLVGRGLAGVGWDRRAGDRSRRARGGGPRLWRGCGWRGGGRSRGGGRAARSTAAPRARARAGVGSAGPARRRSRPTLGRGPLRRLGRGRRRPRGWHGGGVSAKQVSAARRRSLQAQAPARDCRGSLPLWWGCRSGGVERREAFDGRRRPRRRAGRRSGSVRGHRRAPRGRGQGEPWSAIGPPLVRGRWRAASPGSPLADTARWGPAGLRRVGADRHDHQARLHQVIDQEARRPPDRHRRRAVTPQPSGRRRQPLAVVADLEPLQRRALGVEHAGRVGAAAPVDAREPLLHGPPPPIWSKAPSAVARRGGGTATTNGSRATCRATGGAPQLGRRGAVVVRTRRWRCATAGCARRNFGPAVAGGGAPPRSAHRAHG